MNETSKISLSQINFEIINTPRMDNSGHEFQHIAPCYSIIQQRFKHQFGQNFMVLRDFTVALVLRLYWESLCSLQRKILLQHYPALVKIQ